MKYVLCLALLAGCAGSLPSTDTILADVDKAKDAAIEICLLAHSINARVNKEPELSEYQGKIDEICDPALAALDGASSASAKSTLDVLRQAIGELMRK